MGTDGSDDCECECEWESLPESGQNIGGDGVKEGDGEGDNDHEGHGDDDGGFLGVSGSL